MSGLLEIATAFGKVGTKLGDTSQDFNQQVSKSNLGKLVDRTTHGSYRGNHHCTCTIVDVSSN